VLAANGSNIDLFQPDPGAGAGLKAKLGLQEKFVVMYGGIHGVAQGLEIVIEAARLLQDQSAIQLVFVGEGPKKQELLALHDEYQLKNLLMLPGQPLERMATYLSMADAALVPLRKLDLFLGALPTKMFDAWACQTPTLISVDGEARQVLERVGAGVFVEPENPQAMATAIIDLKNRRDELRRMGLAGHNAVQAKYSLQASAKKIESVLQTVVGEER
jgi:glycosyltransferase involved in cell wall biosynthesis